MPNFKNPELVSVHTCPKCGHVGQRYAPLCFRCRERKKPPRPKERACIRCGKMGQRNSNLCLQCAGLEKPDYRGYVCACGKPKDFMSKSCHDCYHPNPWTGAEDEIIRALYPSKGAKSLMALLPQRTYNNIRDRAYKLGVVLNKKMYRKTVHDKAAQHMRQHNPSRQPGASERLSKAGQEAWKRPEVAAKMLKGSRDAQKGKPTKLELKLFSILDSLGIAYESYVIVKPKFIVDVRIGNVIIQADGDWWHGHPRFYPLTATQHKQQLRDKAQDAYMAQCGYTVIRIWESDMCLESVISALANADVVCQPLLIAV